MVEYRYQAVDRTGQVVRGKIIAESVEQAAIKVKNELGLVPVEISEDLPKFRRKSRIGGSKQNFLLRFTQQLADLLNSGIQVDDALGVLIQLTGDLEFKKKIEEIRDDIQGGADLSQALTKHPDLFNESYVNMVRAGESGGVLGLCFQRLADYIEQDKEFRGSIKSALVYPFIVMSMGLIAVVVLFIFVIPRFVNLFNDLGQTLPLPTRILLGISNIFLNYWLFILIGLAAVISSYIYYKQTPDGKYQVDVIKNKIPFFGQVRIKLTVSRFCRILGTMLESGVPLLKGLEIAKSTINNQVFIRILDNLYEAVRKGETLSGFLKNEPDFPELAVFLIGVGERTGNLEGMLTRIAETFAKEVKRSLDAFLTIFEPMVILILGIFVLFVVISILLPIFSLQQMPF
ncbi:hypothetical protein BBF96_03690 [Anoxybacter fermentans]|uniref:Type II secretion system protein GspF domain-containing protein n=1 Tax=Anoxybacter fermentans TaxID=1323375 RepID=A0A3S9SWA6_9FIRM|nr:type II secretion system F family protein [Anoxybacter fermentans]AZR72564.1 hypothetical protein BBF96_03690 [Anoxybacter fermentans]